MDAVIFDVDGTLWDSTQVVAKAWNQAIEEAGIVREGITPDILKGEFGKPMNVVADNLFPETDEQTKEKMMQVCCEYEHRLLEEWPGNLLYPGVREVFEGLSKKCKICIVSNCQSGYIEMFLKKNHLEQYVTDMECYGNTKKSKGENIKAVVQRNGFRDSIYVGDTKGDFDAAVFANVPFVFATYGFGTVTEECKQIEDIRELLLVN